MGSNDVSFFSLELVIFCCLLHIVLVRTAWAGKFVVLVQCLRVYFDINRVANKKFTQIGQGIFSDAVTSLTLVKGVNGTGSLENIVGVSLLTKNSCLLQKIINNCV